MNFYTKQHKYYCGIDLRANKMYLCIQDETEEIRSHRNIITDRESSSRTRFEIKSVTQLIGSA